ncbi:MAG: TetR/AcrR family transcriptional regulator [Cyclobacteriaceae bacterium]|nr:TetR/AcrR family transcriptional regulator [Cyclobacteriaceae bacterium]
MEKTKKSKSSSKATSSAKIIAGYREYLLTEGNQPASVFKFCKDHGFNETEFYQFFGSFEAIEKSIWQEFIVDTRTRMEADSNYQAFTTREKILTFYFMLAESLKTERSFVLYQLKGWKNPSIVPSFLKGFKTSFEEWLNSVLNEGKGTGEIAKRPFLDQRYDMLFWLHLMFILQFWSHDESANFEKTDAAIEKSVNLAFDLIGKGVLDNAIDFGKFLYQNSKN